MNRISVALLLIIAFGLSSRAVTIDTAGTITYNGLDPDNPSNPSGTVSGWDTGWGATSATGWNYVGYMDDSPAGNNQLSGTYLGNGWVITAAHVVPAVGQNFAMNTTGTKVDYTITNVVATPFTTTYDGATYSVDLSLFQIAAPPNLPSLTLATSPPTPAVDSAVMIGFRGGVGETWGQNTVTGSTLVGIGPGTGYPPDFTYVSSDFYTDWDPTGVGNKAVLNSGDSGGGDYIFNATLGIWELAGINEAVQNDDTQPDYNSSYMVQLSDYANQIYAITGTPEPDAFTLVCLGGAALGFGRWLRARLTRP